MHVGSKLVVETVKQIEQNKVKMFKQPEIDEKPAPKIYSETCKINWNDSLNNIYNLIRGLNPYPAAWATLINNNDEIKVKIYDITKIVEAHNYKIGTIITSKDEIKVAVKKGFIKINSLQLSGKRRMDTKSLLNGFTFYENTVMQ